MRTGDTYAWTGHGNGSTAYTQNGRNQQISIGGAAASWDSKGNLTSEPQSGKTYGYSSENMLTSASGGVTLAYDPAMRLYQVAGAATTKFAYDDLDSIAEYDGSNALQRRFVFGPGMDEPLVQYEGTGTSDRRFMGTDERGSVISLTNSAGTLLTINRYDEYGKPQSGNVGRFQYTGQKWIGELGAYDYKARVYLPHLGIFAQTDPAGYKDSPNLYGYVIADPISFVDPLGMDVTCTGSRIPRESCGSVPGLSCIGECSNFLSPAQRIQARIRDVFGEARRIAEYVCVLRCNNPPSGGDRNGEIFVFAPAVYKWVIPGQSEATSGPTVTIAAAGRGGTDYCGSRGTGGGYRIA